MRDEIPGFPARLRQLREAAQLSQAALAKAAETDVMSVSRMERGARYPTLHMAQRLAAALGCTIDALVKTDEVAPAIRNRLLKPVI